MSIKKNHIALNPLDVIILLKIVTLEGVQWRQGDVAVDLRISQSEVSKSLERSRYAGLLTRDNQVMKMSLHDFLVFGVKYAFPQKPGAMAVGEPTSHSAYPLNKEVVAVEHYVWPHPEGSMRGQSVQPLYPSVPEFSKDEKNKELTELLSLVDAIRVGRARERNMAVDLLKARLYA